MGDGVNIAARLEGICEPGGICLSEAAYDRSATGLSFEFVDLGPRSNSRTLRARCAPTLLRRGSPPRRISSRQRGPRAPPPAAGRRLVGA